MNKNLQRSYQNKHSKSSRKSHTSERRSNKTGELSSQLPQQSDIQSEHTTNNFDHDLLSEIIEDLTSDIDDTRTPSTPSILSTKSNTKNDETSSPPIQNRFLSVNPLRNPTCLIKKKPSRSTRKGGKSDQYEEKTLDLSNYSNSFDEKYDILNSRKSIGEQRRDQLTKYMKEFYQACFLLDQNSTINYVHDTLTNNNKRKQYSTALWYELKTFFNGTNSLNEAGIKNEQYLIDRQRKKSLEEFYHFFSQCDFEQAHYHDTLTIQRRHLCEYHLNHCYDVEKRMKNLFSKWDYILSLFPSYSALEHYDKRFNPRTKEGRIFYEKLYIFQAWFNLHSEINHLINVLGRIMTCMKCHMWPHETNLSLVKHNDNLSRPTTPSSTSSHEQRDPIVGSPPNISPFLVTPEIRIKRQSTFTSMSSFDSIYQPPLTSSSSLMDYYY
ncbi:unnamed protein product, partial [Rotaria sp. Silwood1]